MRKIVFTAITVSVCLSTLLLAFISLPKLSHAATSKSTPAPTISVSPKKLPDASCTSINIPSSDPAFTYQACKVSISTSGPFNNKLVSWSMSVSAQFCYHSCQPYSSAYFGIVKGNGQVALYGGSQEDVLLIMPQAQQYGGNINATFTFSGPSNKITVQFSV